MLLALMDLQWSVQSWSLDWKQLQGNRFDGGVFEDTVTDVL